MGSISFFQNLGRRGQASIEIIMLVMIIALFIQTVVNPSLTIAAASGKETARIGQARFAAEKLANTIDAVSVAPGENKRTITLFVPGNTILTCQLSDIGATCVNGICFQVALDGILLNAYSAPSACINDIDGDNEKCAKVFDLLLDSSSVNCSGGLKIDNMDNYAGIVVTLEVEKDGSTTTVKLA
ncbi:MAG: hypothetical protein ABID38_00885 [Candidatus Diapherotrites archaeon]